MNRSAGPRIIIAAGEASGDLHAAHLVEALRAHIPNASFRGFGGARLEEVGVELREDLVEHSVMGFLPVLRSLGGIFGTIARFEEEFRTDPPDLLIVVDYPGLNLNLARLARAHGVTVVAYICPQVWAWAPWRIGRVARRADLLLVILPFEEEIYAAVHPRVRFVGNPVFDHLASQDVGETERGELAEGGTRCLALLPGSRRQEVNANLGPQLRVAAALQAVDPTFRVWVSCQRPALRASIEAQIAAAPIEARVFPGSTHELQRRADLALVCSGTATLEQAWYGAPMVVMYAADELERSLFELFAVAPHFALVNLFAGREVVPEILFTPGDEEEVVRRAKPLIAGPERQRVIEDLRRLRKDRFIGGAAEHAATEIADFLRDRGRIG